MTNLGDIFNQVVFLLGKDKVGGYVSPLNFNEAVKSINTEYLNDLVNQFEMTKQMSNALRNLIKTIGGANSLPLALDAYGYGDIPSDLRYEVRSSYNQFYNTNCAGEKQYRSVTFVSQHEWNHRHDVEMYHPTKEEPIWCFEDGKIRVSPILPSFQFTYIRNAATPYFDYDIIDGEPVYLPVGAVHANSSVEPAGSASLSVEYEFPTSCYNELVNMLVKYFAIGNREDFNIKVPNE
jgi:hypothetical protein